MANNSLCQILPIFMSQTPKNVSNDVNYLKEIGLIELKKTKEGRAKSTPSVNYDKILLEIPI